MPRGRPIKPDPAYRPQLRVKKSTLTRALALGVDEVAAALDYILPRWPMTAQGRAQDSQVIVRPAQPVTRETALLWVSGRTLHARLEQKHELFRDAVKSLGLRWVGPSWQRDLPGRAGSVRDRLAEVATRLLEAGFAVRVPDEAHADLVLSGEWTPEHRRWVVGLKSGRVGLSWEFGADPVWQAARNLPDAEYDGETRMVNLRAWHYAEVRDFAAHHGFLLTPEAEALLSDAERDFEGGRLFMPRPAKIAPLPSVQPEASELGVIPADLLDD